METQQKPEVTFRILDEKMRITVDCPVDPGEEDAVCKIIAEKLRLINVVKPALEIDLRQWLAKVGEGKSAIEGAVLFEGKTPVPPVDGHIKWEGDFFNEGFVTDEATGTVDFRHRAAKVTVAEGQLLATLIPPIPGKEGRDVFGGRVKVLRARKERLGAGKNVRRDGHDRFYAECDGRIRKEGHTIQVDSVYKILGDVGLKTGDIDHPGAVIIDRDICEGAEVIAEGDIEVFGIIEKATVKAGGNLTVHGGIVGAKGQSVTAKGDIHARYIMDADVHADGNLVVEKEIVQSTVQTRGAILIRHGRIVGGGASALEGIEVGQTGSEASIQTHLTIGRDPQRETELHAREHALEEMEKSRVKILKTVTPLARHIDKLPPEKAQAVKTLLQQLKKLEKEIEETRAEIDEMRAQFAPEAGLKVVILDTVFPETTFAIRRTTLRLRKRIRGPVKACLRDGKVRLTRDKSEK